MKFKKFGKALLLSALTAGIVLSITSCVRSYTVGFLYVTGTTSAAPNGNGIISGFKIDHNTGYLKSIHGLPVSSGGAHPVRAVLLSGSRFLYVLNQGLTAAGDGNCSTAEPCQHSNIVQFSVGANGVLAQQETFYPQGLNPERMLTDGSGGYIFILDHDAPSSSACQLALGSGVTSCGAIEVYRVDATTGRLQIVVNAQVTSASGSPLPYFPVPADPIDFVQTSANVITLYGTPATGDYTFPYSYTSASGQLTISQNSSQALNVSNATAMNYAGGSVYVLSNDPISYSSGGNTQTAPSRILPFTIGSNGSLQSMTGGDKPDDPSQANPVQFLLESKGKWAYVANAGLNNTSTGTTQDGLAGFVLDSSSKELSFIPGEPWGTGSAPVCLVEDPSNQFLYTADYNTGTVSGHMIDQNAGVLDNLTRTGTFTVSGPATWCLINGRTN